MEKYWDLFVRGYTGYADYLWGDITNPKWHSFFYMLILVSAIFFILEVVVPWRKKQPIPRKDFWLDAFYMFFNIFLFSLIIYSAGSNVIVALFNDTIKSLTGGFDLQAVNPMNSFPYWAVLLIGMIARDFIQWWVHRLLHRIDWLWNFHKVHHSVEQMGFAAQLRYHWMENIVYRSLEYIPLALMGIGFYDFFVIHIFALTWGHFNHANITVNPKISGGIVGGLIGLIIANGWLEVTVLQDPSMFTMIAVVLAGVAVGVFLMAPYMRVLFNSPEMHIWHHAHDLPESHRYGVNFGLTLACWDYIFGTAYVPYDGQDVKLGFPGLEKFPNDFIHQNTYGFGKSDE